MMVVVVVVVVVMAVVWCGLVSDMYVPFDPLATPRPFSVSAAQYALA